VSEAEPVDLLFAALAHPIRRKIVEHLAGYGPTSVSDLAEPFAVSLMAISKHVKVLSESGVILVEKEGRVNWCSLNFETLRQARDWLDYQYSVASGKQEQLELL
jgi:DNA-binding transcriptional ArsR family regulator